MGDPRRVCPECQKGDGLWIGYEVIESGWKDYKDGQVSGPMRVEDRIAEEEQDFVGCSHCEWEGGTVDLVTLGTDGEPLATVHPDQLEAL